MTRRRSPVPVHGFTLVELLVVVLIIGILAAIALPRFVGQRTRAKNAAAQAAVRHALLAARSYYTQAGESYAGLDGTALKGYESSLSGSEPLDGQTPGSSANPQDIWIGDGSTGAAPGAQTVVLCSVSRGDTVYCVKDVAGTTTYLAMSGASAGTAAAGSFSASGWGATTASAGTRILYDTFTESVGTPTLQSHTPETGSQWVRHAASWNTYSVYLDSASGVVYPSVPAGVNTIYYNPVVPASNAQELRVTAIRKGAYNTAQSIRMYCRMSSTANGTPGDPQSAIMAYITNDRASNVRLALGRYTTASGTTSLNWLNGGTFVDFSMTQNSEYLFSLVCQDTRTILRTSIDGGSNWTTQIDTTDANVPTTVGYFGLALTDTSLGVAGSMVATELSGYNLN